MLERSRQRQWQPGLGAGFLVPERLQHGAALVCRPERARRRGKLHHLVQLLPRCAGTPRRQSAPKHLVARPDSLDLHTETGLWVRLMDVGAALSARGYAADGRVTFDIADDFCPWNAGTWTLADGVARRSRRRPDLRLDVTALGATYLGGFSFARLARVGLVEEARRGAAGRADALFASDRAPWCPELF